MKKLFVISVLVIVLSLLIFGAASAGGGWNKWQPIQHDVVTGEFKYSGDTLLKIKEYYGSFDIVAYLIPGMIGTPADWEYFDNNYYDPICVPQGATSRTSFAAAWFAEITGRDDLSELGFDLVTQRPDGGGYGDLIFFCIYPSGWLDDH